MSSLGLTQSSKTHTPIHTQFRNSPITLDSNLLNTFLLTRHICLSLHSPQLPVPEHLKKSPITERCLSYFSRYHCLNLKLHSAFCPYGIFSNSLFLTLVSHYFQSDDFSAPSLSPFTGRKTNCLQIMNETTSNLSTTINIYSQAGVLRERLGPGLGSTVGRGLTV